MIAPLRFTLLGALLLAITANGKPTFSDKPCDGSAREKGSMSGKTAASPAPTDAADAAAGYATPHGSWGGLAQYQAKLGTQLIEEAHAVVPVMLSIDTDGKVTGGSPDNGCRLLGLASPGIVKTMLWLDVTLSRCKYAPLNRRYSGSISIHAKGKAAQLKLDAHTIGTGVAPQFFDLRGTLRR